MSRTHWLNRIRVKTHQKNAYQENYRSTTDRLTKAPIRMWNIVNAFGEYSVSLRLCVVFVRGQGYLHPISPVYSQRYLTSPSPQPLPPRPTRPRTLILIQRHQIPFLSNSYARCLLPLPHPPRQTRQSTHRYAHSSNASNTPRLGFSFPLSVFSPHSGGREEQEGGIG